MWEFHWVVQLEQKKAEMMAEKSAFHSVAQMDKTMADLRVALWDDLTVAELDLQSEHLKADKMDD